MRNLVLLSLLLLLPACQTGHIDVYGCKEPCRDCEDPCTPCPHGECVPLPPLGWEGPVLLWVGSEEEAPGCPERAPNTVYEGHDGLTYTPQCPECSCGPSACVHSGLIAWGAADCLPAGSETPYPAPEGWQGECTSNGTIPEAQFGSIELLAPTEAPCEALTGTVPKQADIRWGTLARACQTSEPLGACDAATLCVPTSEPPPEGFSQCLFKEGDQGECPFGYPERRVFYEGIDTSAAGCTACACSPPEGGACLASMVAYEDALCLDAFTTGSPYLDAPDCTNAMPGYDLRGMSASWMVNEPGTCTASGGEPFGEAKPAIPATFCCQVKPL